MWLLIIPIFFGLILFTQIAVNDEAPSRELQRQAKAELIRYRVFVSTADTYFKGVAAPGTTTSYGWEQIKAAAPPGLATTGIRADWRVVRKPDGQWAACTQLNEMSVARINEIFAPAQPASGASEAFGGRVLPGALTSGGTGAIAFGGTEQITGLVSVGTPTDAMNAANLCDTPG